MMSLQARREKGRFIGWRGGERPARRSSGYFGSPFVVIALIGIIICAAAYSIIFAAGPTHFGDDIAYSFSAHYFAIGTFKQSFGDILTLRILQIFPIGVFYRLFGYGILSSSAWDITAFILTIFLTFLIGREMYDEYVGLLSSLLIAAFPMAAIYSVTMSDNPTMMFFVCLSVFAFLRAMKTKSKGWYFATGLTLILAPLTTPEGLILWIVLFLFFVIEILRRRQGLDVNILYLAVGFLIVFGTLCLFNYLNSGYPLITFKANALYYSQTYRPDIAPQPFWPSVMFYVNVMFPYSILHNFYGIVIGNTGLSGIARIYNPGIGDVGFYFYALLVAAAYLILRRDRKVYFPLFWIAISLLYLEFGPMQVGLHPLTYVLSHRLDRYLLILAPAMAIIIAASLAAFVRGTKRKIKHYVKYGVGILIVIFLVSTSIPIIFFSHQIMSAESYTQRTVAAFLDNVPNSTKIYLDGGYGDVALYMKFNNLSRFEFGYGGQVDCRGMINGSYVILPRYNSIGGLNYTPAPPSYCNWTLVLSPQLPQQLQDVSSIAATDQTDLYLVKR